MGGIIPLAIHPRYNKMTEKFRNPGKQDLPPLPASIHHDVRKSTLSSLPWGTESLEAMTRN